MSELESSDLVVCINPEARQYGKLGVVFQLRHGPWADVDFRWGGGGLYRCPIGDFTLVEKGWNTKWLAARAVGEPEYPLPVVDVDDFRDYAQSMTNTYEADQTTSGNVRGEGVALGFQYKTIPGLITVKGNAGTGLADPLEAVGTPETLLLMGEALVFFAKEEMRRRKPTVTYNAGQDRTGLRTWKNC